MSSKICPVCNTNFHVKPSHYNKRTYCGKVCQGIGYKTQLSGTSNPHYSNAGSKTCLQCGEEFKNYIKTRKYCSNKCRGLASRSQKINRKCEMCQSEFAISPTSKDDLSRRFCSPSCSHSSMIEQNRINRQYKEPQEPRRHDKKCKGCGELFVTTSMTRKYCTDNCRIKMFSTGPTDQTMCRICGATIRVSPSCVNKVSTCSKACQSRHRTEQQKGELSHRWRGGKTKQVMLVRNSAIYKEWRTRIFQRDKYSCQMCKAIGGRLTAHHIKPFHTHMELALTDTNGVTLCWDCHKTIKNKEVLFEAQFFAITYAKHI